MLLVDLSFKPDILFRDLVREMRLELAQLELFSSYNLLLQPLLVLSIFVRLFQYLLSQFGLITHVTLDLLWVHTLLSLQ